MVKTLKLAPIFAFSTLLLVPFRDAGGAGWDKLVLWSGRYSGLGNAAASLVTGPEALYFNPARLSDSPGTHLTFNYTSVLSQFQAPVAANNVTLASERLYLPLPSLIVSHAINDWLALGVGAYTAGGDKSDFGDVDYGAASTAATRSTLRSTELSLGLGGRLHGIRVGAAWRISLMNAEFLAASGTGGTAVSSQITDLSGSDFGGFRFGAAYSSEDNRWGIGASLRTEVEWKLTGGKHVIQSLATNPPTPVPGANSEDGTFTSALPLQVALGVHGKVLEQLLLALEYDFYEYHVDQALTITSTAFAAAGIPGGTTIIPLAWKNAHTLRAGLQYDGIPAWPLRFGYVYSTAVTPEEYAFYPFVAPGSSNGFSAGTGHSLSEAVTLNGALEYAFAKGSVPQGTPAALSGDYKTDAWSLHLGMDVKL